MIVERWFVFGRASAWGPGLVDLTGRSMAGHGGTLVRLLESVPAWMVSP